MSETLKWIMTQDHKPTFEECEGNAVVYHIEGESQESRSIIIFRNRYHWGEYFENLPVIDRYILIDIPEFIPDPEPVPCKVCGSNPEIATTSTVARISCRCDAVPTNDGNHAVTFFAPTRAEAIQLWNKWNGG